MIRVNTIYPTIQGEGALTGVPMVLIRLQGCGVGCPWCDTKETWDVFEDERTLTLAFAKAEPRRWTEMDEAAVASEARKLGPKIGWALVTGGEPSEQPLASLVDALHEVGFSVALETSGTAAGHVDALFDWVCVSPKLDMPGGKPVFAHVVETTADEVKMVVGRRSDVDRFTTWLKPFSFTNAVVISLQPLSSNPKATDICVQACLEKGWRLSVQAHKAINIP